MEQAIISGIAFNRDEAKISVMGVEDTSGHCLQYPRPDRRRQCRRRHDRAEHRRVGAYRFLVHREPQRVPEGAGRACQRSVARRSPHARSSATTRSARSRSSASACARTSASRAEMFKALADEGINIQMISTSEIKISVVIDEKYLELAVRVLHALSSWTARRRKRNCRFLRENFTRAFDAGACAPLQSKRFPETWPSGRRHSPAKGAYGPKPVSRVRIPASPPDKYLIARTSSLQQSIPWPNRGQIRRCASRARETCRRRRSTSNTRGTACSRWCGRVAARCSKDSRQPSKPVWRTCAESDTARGTASPGASGSAARFCAAIEYRPKARP